ncbi:MAG: HAMP domain-containing sensor histidine kinase, partial [Spirochaetaceae bacterium]|nr:HAMP domain-containing sensor histidine kinase [Spirochaetaceae bacterium]
FFILATAVLLATLIKQDQLNLERIVADQTRELRKTNDDLRSSLSVLVRNERMAALASLVAGFSHEISTPIGNALTAVTYLEELQNNKLLSQRNDVATMVDSASRSLTKAASLVRSFKTVVVDRTKEGNSLFYLRNTILDSLKSFQQRIERLGHTVTADIPEELLLYGDPGKIHQITVNLIENSLQHGFSEPNHKGIISIHAAEIDNSLVLTYRDNGIGLSIKARHYLFEPFFTTARNSGSVGIGMYIVYNLVIDSLGGSITVENNNGTGIKIVITWPIRRSES